jgi:Uma2 family endonuclease
MRSVIIQHATNAVRVPDWVSDRESFLRWTADATFPDYGRVDYLAGEIWIDMSEEQLFSHNQVKLAFYVALGQLVQEGELGRFFPDGARLVHPEADLSAVPDAVFVSDNRFEQMRVRFIGGAERGFVRIEGGPDMVLEVISDSSVQKDTVRLREMYRAAGVREYWLVDARREPLTFDILRQTARGFVAARRQGGWVRSTVFDKSFRLISDTDKHGRPRYTLEVR